VDLARLGEIGDPGPAPSSALQYIHIALQHWNISTFFSGNFGILLASCDQALKIVASALSQISPELGMPPNRQRCHLKAAAGASTMRAALQRRAGFSSPLPLRPCSSSTGCGRSVQQMSTRRGSLRIVIHIGLAVCAAVALYALAVVLLVSP
jgi:hypothetical protein